MKKTLITIVCILCFLLPIFSSTSVEAIYIKEMERISIDIFQTYEDELEVYGYQVINGKYSKLPIGSVLDKKKGKFYWLPGPGFVGEYEFVFKSLKLVLEKKVKIYIKPKFGELNVSKVRKEISRASSSEKPFGSFDTPIDGSTVASSIAVTGWALDDNGIENVKIYREQGNTLIYIGDAMLVEGARPDVAAAYPGYPNNTRAGWGYMMLTNFLPNSGNGTFVIHAIATDTVGKSNTLGSKTILCDNANAVKPFGTIDTPIQGGEATGSSFINWGWVLTPQPNSIPTDGSTIKVWVDGVSLGNPTYNIYRSDIATLFPGYANSDGAIGYFYLDTTQYASGVHTIQWTATDSGGNSDGIGSRYFSIKHTLTVTKGTGVDGTPNSGTYTHNEGDTVNYNYSLQSGYTNLVVTLDDNTVANSGIITMDSEHTLTATATVQGTINIEWINIPAGNFQMGDNFNEGHSDERPVHTVYLSAYKISKYEVTFEQYDAFCDDTGRSRPDDEGWGRGSRPVINVSWNDAKVFCDWLSQKIGMNINLPTEAQWEKAARGTDQSRYPWGNSDPSCSIVNYYWCQSKTMPVGSYPSGVSPYGVHDMAGNVWELCKDWYSSTYYSISPTNNPPGPSSGFGRVLRGGSWSGSDYIRSAYRYISFSPHCTSHLIGFRLSQD